MELDLIQISVALFAGLIGGLVSEIGGAGTLFSLPMLVGLGLGPDMANGTNRIGVMFQYTSGYFRFLSHKSVPHREAALLSIPLVIGAVLGAYFAVTIAGEIFNWIFIGVMIVSIIFNIFSKDFNDTPDSTDKPLERSRIVDYLLFVIVGLYCGMIQAGMSYVIYYVLVRRLGTTVRTAEAIRNYMSMIVTPFALAIFIYFGSIDWNLAASLALGGGLGGWLGARMVERRSHHEIKEWLTTALIISVIYMVIFMLRHLSLGVHYL